MSTQQPAISLFLKDLPDAVAKVSTGCKPSTPFLGAAAELLAAHHLGWTLVSDTTDGHDAEHGPDWIEIRSSTNDIQPKTGASKDHNVFCWVRFKIDGGHLWLTGISTRPRGSGSSTQHLKVSPQKVF